MDLLAPGEKRGFGLPEAVVLAVYASLLVWCIPRHESWFDEAQAWLIARDSSLSDLVLHRLHYEGAPALWHLLLWLEARLHVSFLGMHLISGLFATAGIYIWLRFNSLPRVLSLLLPFTFFLQYQFAVIARSYSLFPLFAFSLMALYQNRKSNPIFFCIVAGLMANCSLHMAAFAAGMVILYAMDRVPQLRESAAPDVRRRFAVPVFILLFFFVISAAVARPTADGSFGNSIIVKIRQEVSRQGASAPQEQTPSKDNPSPYVEPLNEGSVARAIWHTIYLAPSATQKQKLLAKAVKHTLVIPTALTAPIAISNILALAFLVLLAINLSQEHLLITLIPYALVLFVFVIVAGASHHLGILWVALLCPLWMLSLRPVPSGQGRLARQALYGVTLLVVCLQIGWSIDCIRADLNGPYSGDEAAAQFLRSHPVNGCVDSFDVGSITANAYLDKLPYCNQSLSYWPFSQVHDPSLFVNQWMARRPAMVVTAEITVGHPFTNQWVTTVPPGSLQADTDMLQLLKQDGYHETHRFCGQHLFRNTSEVEECRVLFEPNPDVMPVAPVPTAR